MPSKQPLQHDNEKQLRRKSQESSRGIGQNRPISPQTLTRMQQRQGNAFVQRMLAQRKQQDEAAEASAKLAYSTSYSTATKAQVTRTGGLQMDVRNATDMRRYGDIAKPYRNAVREWAGSGTVKLGDDTFEMSHVQMDRDGKLDLQLGEEFLQKLLETASGDKLGRVDFNQLHSANVKATLHYRSQDPRLQSAEVPNKDNLLGDVDKQGFFLKLEIESVVLISAEGQQEEKEICGEIILAGAIKPE